MFKIKLKEPSTLTDKDHIKSFFYSDELKLQCRLNTWNENGVNKIPLYVWLGDKIISSRLKKEQKILDIGCGTGLLLKYIINRPNNIVYGIDISSKMVEVTRKKLPKKMKKNVHIGDIEKLPFPDNFFDHVIASHVLQHVSNIKKALQEMKRVAKFGGKIWITTSDLKLNKGLNAIHYFALQKNKFPNYMLNKKQYLRFTPKIAVDLFHKLYSKTTILKYKNDCILKTKEVCLNYYHSAMMYRNSYGPTDQRIDEKKWDKQILEVEKQIDKKLRKNKKIIMPGTVIALCGIK